MHQIIELFRFILSTTIYGVVLMLLLFGNLNVAAQKSKTKLQDDKTKLEKDIAYTNKLLGETKKDKQISLNKLIILNNKINQRESLINNINGEIGDLEGQIESTQAETTQLTAKIKILKGEYAKMIYFAYKHRNAYLRLMFLFASADFNQVFLRLKYLQLITKYRRKQVELIKAANEKLSGNISKLKKIKQEKRIFLQPKKLKSSSSKKKSWKRMLL